MFDQFSTKLCDCECHSDNCTGILEFMPCCNLCGRQYIDKNGTVDHARLLKHLQEHEQWRRSRKRER
jgi:hypothetical protein